MLSPIATAPDHWQVLDQSDRETLACFFCQLTLPERLALQILCPQLGRRVRGRNKVFVCGQRCAKAQGCPSIKNLKAAAIQRLR